MLTKEKYILLAAGILSVMASFELIRKRRFARMLIQGGAFLAMLLTGMRVTDRELTKIAAYQAYIGEKQPVACQGRIYRKEVTDDQTVLYLKDCIFQVKSVNYSCNHILVYFDTGQYPIGKTIVVKGVLYPLSEARNEGNFNEKAYYRAKQIDFKVKQAKLLGIYGETNWFAEKLFALAERLKRVYQKEMSPQNAGVMMGMVLGDKSQLDSEIKTMYQKSGLSHVLCVSGVKTLKLDIPLVPETRINWAFVPPHIAIIYILKLCLDEEIIPRCRFPCSRGYLTKCINWQKKQ